MTVVCGEVSESKRVTSGAVSWGSGSVLQDKSKAVKMVIDSKRIDNFFIMINTPILNYSAV